MMLLHDTWISIMNEYTVKPRFCETVGQQHVQRKIEIWFKVGAFYFVNFKYGHQDSI